jgi:hypothetical protein
MFFKHCRRMLRWGFVDGFFKSASGAPQTGPVGPVDVAAPA